MRLTLSVFALATALSVPVVAQDSEVISMTGCLREDSPRHTYTLVSTTGGGRQGHLSSYEIELSSYVGRQVELAAILTDADNATGRSRTAAGPQGKYTVVSVKPLAGRCAAR
jgi:hypothetical protein